MKKSLLFLFLVLGVQEAAVAAARTGSGMFQRFSQFVGPLKNGFAQNVHGPRVKPFPQQVEEQFHKVDVSFMQQQTMISNMEKNSRDAQEKLAKLIEAQQAQILKMEENSKKRSFFELIAALLVIGPVANWIGDKIFKEEDVLREREIQMETLNILREMKDARHKEEAERRQVAELRKRTDEFMPKNFLLVTQKMFENLLGKKS